MVDRSSEHNAQDYEQRYRQGYGLLYPESHIIRVHRHILEWELGMKPGRAFDFGCGAGANLRYFAEQGFTPFGCDTSMTAIERCKQAMPEFADNFWNTPVRPDLLSLVPSGSLDVFLSNQVLYFLSDSDIHHVVDQAHAMVRPGGVFVATMMAWTCWYARSIVGREGDFRRVEMDTPRQKLSTLINFKDRADLLDLFAPFRKLHLGSYGSTIREDEGSTDHWIFVGIRD
jgi:SAM-dependent methyltransferase